MPIPIAYGALSGTWKPTHGLDDVLRYSNQYFTAYSQNYLSHSLYTMNTGYRFDNITIPKDATIESATLELRISQTGTFEVRIHAFDYGNFPRFPSQKTVYDALTRTEENVTWSAPVTAHNFYNSTDLASVMQVIINRDDWVSGNAIGFEAVDTNVETDLVRQYAYEAGIGFRQKLHVTYTIAPRPYITFYNQSNSVFMVNGTKIVNGTTVDYENLTVIELQGIINVSTQFIEFDFTVGNAEINPYNYTTITNTTIWLITANVTGGNGNGNGDGETLFLFGSVNAVPINLLFYIVSTAIGLTLLLKAQFLGKILSVLLFAFQAIWVSGDVLLDTQINYISAYNETTGIYRYANTVTHIGTPILSFLTILSIGLALKSAVDVFREREKRKG